MALLDGSMSELLEWIPAAIAALSSVIVFFIFLKRRVSKLVHRVKDVANRFEQHSAQLDDLTNKVTIVLSEVSPNGGSSMKDVVKRIEHRLYELELTSLTVLDHEQRGVFKTNSSGEIVWLNRSCAQAFDRGRDDLLRYGWLSCVVTEERASIAEEWENAVHLQRQVSLEFSIDTISGNRRELLIKGYPILGNNQVFLGYIGTVNTPQ